MFAKFVKQHNAWGFYKYNYLHLENWLSIFRRITIIKNYIRRYLIQLMKFALIIYCIFLQNVLTIQTFVLNRFDCLPPGAVRNLSCSVFFFL